MHHDDPIQNRRRLHRQPVRGPAFGLRGRARSAAPAGTARGGDTGRAGARLSLGEGALPLGRQSLGMGPGTLEGRLLIAWSFTLHGETATRLGGVAVLLSDTDRHRRERWLERRREDEAAAAGCHRPGGKPGLEARAR
ncbi:hypothetical protein BGLA2_60118 [Burkholderia gladioli]|nr:hypothetical protein BGLA2_60118 [Burkholderia gladioli]